MTFAQAVKGTMLSVKTESLCCKKAFLYGILLFAHSFEERKIILVSENEALIKVIVTLFKQLLDLDLSGNLKKISMAKGEQYRLILEDSDTEKILRYFSYAPPYKTYAILKETLECDECRGSFLRGAFLSCGNIASPQKSYHLEFVISHFNLSRDLFVFLKDCSLEGKYTKRTGHYIIYYKDSEEIIDLLTFTGAHNSVFDFVNTKIEKDIRNTCNRVTNCETANLQKTIVSSSNQIDAIQKLKRSGLFDSLSEKLKMTASLRLENPDMAIGELATLHVPPITKSCAGHRLNKLTELSQQ
jgi:conserved hypothetical protein